MHLKSIALAAVALLVAACSDEPPGNLKIDTGPGPSGDGAKAFFINTVYPELDRDQGEDPDTGKLREGCVRCHSVGESGAPIWLKETAGPAYDTLDTYESPYGSQLIAIPDNSELMLHGEHTGPKLSTTQEKLVRDWLELEAEERGLVGAGTSGGLSASSGGSSGDPPLPTITVAEALEQWGNCMSLDDWTETGMDQLFNSQTVGSGACNGCHSTGQAGAYLSDNTGDTFAANRKKPYMLKLVVGKVSPQGAFEDLAEARRFELKGTEKCTLDPANQALCHPVYALDTDATNSISEFFKRTKARWTETDGACDGGGGPGGGGGAGGEGGGGGEGGAGQ